MDRRPHHTHPILWRSSLGAVCVTVLSLASPSLVGSQSLRPIPLDYQAPQSVIDSAAERELFQLINQVRSHYHRLPLVLDSLLQAAARAHSRDMALHGYFGHTSPQGQSFIDRLVAAGVRGGTRVGENVAFADSVQDAHAAFLASPHHLRTIIDPAFHRVGLGVATAGQMGLAVTEDFSE